MMLNPGMLALHRRTNERWMPETAIITRLTTADDGQGGLTETGTTIVVTVSCRLMPVGQAGQGNRERQLAERIGTDFDWVITLPHGTDATAKDRIVIGTRTFEVVGVFGPHSGEAALRLGAVELG